MKTHNLITGNREGAKWIIIPEIEFVGERKLGQILEPFDIIRHNTGRLHFGSIVGNSLIHIVNTLHKPFTLQSPHFVLIHALHTGIPNIR